MKARLLLTGLTLCLVSLPAPATADPIRSCTTTTGVVVAVDFTPFGGHVERGCDATTTTGYDALHAAGFSTQGDAQDGPEFVCRIDGYPTPDQQPCTRTPSSSSYWSYWYADAGQNRWSYAQEGANSFHPKPGSVDAWVYGATNQSGTTGGPAFSPAAVRATNAAAPAKPRSKQKPTPKPKLTAAPTPSVSHRARTPSSRQPSLHPVAARHRTRRPMPAPSRSTQPTGSVITDVTPQAHRVATSRGSATGTLVGIAVAVVVGGAAATVAWRRRRGPSP